MKHNWERDHRLLFESRRLLFKPVYKHKSWCRPCSRVTRCPCKCNQVKRIFLGPNCTYPQFCRCISSVTGPPWDKPNDLVIRRQKMRREDFRSPKFLSSRRSRSVGRRSTVTPGSGIMRFYAKRRSVSAGAKSPYPGANVKAIAVVNKQKHIRAERSQREESILQSHNKSVSISGDKRSKRGRTGHDKSKRDSSGDKILESEYATGKTSKDMTFDEKISDLEGRKSLDDISDTGMSKKVSDELADGGDRKGKIEVGAEEDGYDQGLKKDADGNDTGEKDTDEIDNAYIGKDKDRIDGEQSTGLGLGTKDSAKISKDEIAVEGKSSTDKGKKGARDKRGSSATAAEKRSSSLLGKKTSYSEKHASKDSIAKKTDSKASEREVSVEKRVTTEKDIYVEGTSTTEKRETTGEGINATSSKKNRGDFDTGTNEHGEAVQRISDEEISEFMLSGIEKLTKIGDDIRSISDDMKEDNKYTKEYIDKKRAKKRKREESKASKGSAKRNKISKSTANKSKNNMRVRQEGKIVIPPSNKQKSPKLSEKTSKASMKSEKASKASLKSEKASKSGSLGRRKSKDRKKSKKKKQSLTSNTDEQNKTDVNDDKTKRARVPGGKDKDGIFKGDIGGEDVKNQDMGESKAVVFHDGEKDEIINDKEERGIAHTGSIQDKEESYHRKTVEDKSKRQEMLENKSETHRDDEVKLIQSGNRPERGNDTEFNFKGDTTIDIDRNETKQEDTNRMSKTQDGALLQPPRLTFNDNVDERQPSLISSQNYHSSAVPTDPKTEPISSDSLSERRSAQTMFEISNLDDQSAVDLARLGLDFGRGGGGESDRSLTNIGSDIKRDDSFDKTVMEPRKDDRQSAELENERNEIDKDRRFNNVRAISIDNGERQDIASARGQEGYRIKHDIDHENMTTVRDIARSSTNDDRKIATSTDEKERRRATHEKTSRTSISSIKNKGMASIASEKDKADAIRRTSIDSVTMEQQGSVAKGLERKSVDSSEVSRADIVSELQDIRKNKKQRKDSSALSISGDGVYKKLSTESQIRAEHGLLCADSTDETLTRTDSVNRQRITMADHSDDVKRDWAHGVEDGRTKARTDSADNKQQTRAQEVEDGRKKSRTDSSIMDEHRILCKDSSMAESTDNKQRYRTHEVEDGRKKSRTDSSMMDEHLSWCKDSSMAESPDNKHRTHEVKDEGNKSTTDSSIIDEHGIRCKDGSLTDPADNTQRNRTRDAEYGRKKSRTDSSIMNEHLSWCKDSSVTESADNKQRIRTHELEDGTKKSKTDTSIMNEHIGVCKDTGTTDSGVKGTTNLTYGLEDKSRKVRTDSSIMNEHILLCKNSSTEGTGTMSESIYTDTLGKLDEDSMCMDFRTNERRQLRRESSTDQTVTISDSIGNDFGRKDSGKFNQMSMVREDRDIDEQLEHREERTNHQVAGWRDSIKNEPKRDGNHGEDNIRTDFKTNLQIMAQHRQLCKESSTDQTATISDSICNEFGKKDSERFNKLSLLREDIASEKLQTMNEQQLRKKSSFERTGSMIDSHGEELRKISENLIKMRKDSEDIASEISTYLSEYMEFRKKSSSEKTITPRDSKSDIIKRIISENLRKTSMNGEYIATEKSKPLDRHQEHRRKCSTERTITPRDSKTDVIERKISGNLSKMSIDRDDIATEKSKRMDDHPELRRKRSTERTISPRDSKTDVIKRIISENLRKTSIDHEDITIAKSKRMDDHPELRRQSSTDRPITPRDSQIIIDVIKQKMSGNSSKMGIDGEDVATEKSKPLDGHQEHPRKCSTERAITPRDSKTDVIERKFSRNLRKMSMDRDDIATEKSKRVDEHHELRKNGSTEKTINQRDSTIDVIINEAISGNLSKMSISREDITIEESKRMDEHPELRRKSSTEKTTSPRDSKTDVIKRIISENLRKTSIDHEDIDIAKSKRMDDHPELRRQSSTDRIITPGDSQIIIDVIKRKISGNSSKIGIDGEYIATEKSEHFDAYQELRRTSSSKRTTIDSRNQGIRREISGNLRKIDNVDEGMRDGSKIYSGIGDKHLKYGNGSSNDKTATRDDSAKNLFESMGHKEVATDKANTTDEVFELDTKDKNQTATLNDFYDKEVHRRSSGNTRKEGIIDKDIHQENKIDSVVANKDAKHLNKSRTDQPIHNEFFTSSGNFDKRQLSKDIGTEHTLIRNGLMEMGGKGKDSEKFYRSIGVDIPIEHSTHSGINGISVNRDTLDHSIKPKANGIYENDYMKETATRISDNRGAVHIDKTEKQKKTSNIKNKQPVSSVTRQTRKANYSRDELPLVDVETESEASDERDDNEREESETYSENDDTYEREYTGDEGNYSSGGNGEGGDEGEGAGGGNGGDDKRRKDKDDDDDHEKCMETQDDDEENTEEDEEDEDETTAHDSGAVDEVPTRIYGNYMVDSVDIPIDVEIKLYSADADQKKNAGCDDADYYSTQYKFTEESIRINKSLQKLKLDLEREKSQRGKLRGNRCLVNLVSNRIFHYHTPCPSTTVCQPICPPCIPEPCVQYTTCVKRYPCYPSSHVVPYNRYLPCDTFSAPCARYPSCSNYRFCQIKRCSPFYNVYGSYIRACLRSSYLSSYRSYLWRKYLVSYPWNVPPTCRRPCLKSYACSSYTSYRSNLSKSCARYNRNWSCRYRCYQRYSPCYYSVCPRPFSYFGFRYTCPARPVICYSPRYGCPSQPCSYLGCRCGCSSRPSTYLGYRYGCSSRPCTYLGCRYGCYRRSFGCYPCSHRCPYQLTCLPCPALTCPLLKTTTESAKDDVKAAKNESSKNNDESTRKESVADAGVEIREGERADVNDEEAVEESPPSDCDGCFSQVEVDKQAGIKFDTVPPPANDPTKETANLTTSCSAAQHRFKSRCMPSFDTYRTLYESGPLGYPCRGYTPSQFRNELEELDRKNDEIRKTYIWTDKSMEKYSQGELDILLGDANVDSTTDKKTHSTEGTEYEISHKSANTSYDEGFAHYRLQHLKSTVPRTNQHVQADSREDSFPPDRTVSRSTPTPVLSPNSSADAFHRTSKTVDPEDVSSRCMQLIPGESGPADINPSLDAVDLLPKDSHNSNVSRDEKNGSSKTLPNTSSKDMVRLHKNVSIITDKILTREYGTHCDEFEERRVSVCDKSVEAVPNQIKTRLRKSNVPTANTGTQITSFNDPFCHASTSTPDVIPIRHSVDGPEMQISLTQDNSSSSKVPDLSMIMETKHKSPSVPGVPGKSPLTQSDDSVRERVTDQPIPPNVEGSQTRADESLSGQNESRNARKVSSHEGLEIIPTEKDSVDKDLRAKRTCRREVCVETNISQKPSLPKLEQNNTKNQQYVKDYVYAMGNESGRTTPMHPENTQFDVCIDTFVEPGKKKLKRGVNKIGKVVVEVAINLEDDTESEMTIGGTGSDYTENSGQHAMDKLTEKVKEKANQQTPVDLTKVVKI